MRFLKSRVAPERSSGPAWYFCFVQADVLVCSRGGRNSFPFLTFQQAEAFGFGEAYFFGFLDDAPCYCSAATEKFSPEGHEWVSLKDIYLESDAELSAAAGYARQLADWNSNFRFCGRCATPASLVPGEHARKCPRCYLVSYPRISPAVIVSVLKDDQILLARAKNFSDKEMYSVLAGFVEPGESLEEAVRREVMEEVGIAVTNIRYFKSESWPFPDSLMVGFTADYQSGFLQTDNVEIIEAGWFKADALPKVPHRRSLSCELIRRFLSLENGRS